MLACYLWLIRAGFQRYATYRQALVTGLATNVVFGFIRCAYCSPCSPAARRWPAMTPPALLTFVWIGQGLIAVVLIWCNTDFGERVRSGDVAVDGRPVRTPVRAGRRA